MGGTCPRTGAGSVGTPVTSKETVQNCHHLTQTKEAKEGVEEDVEEEEQVGEGVQPPSATTTKIGTIMGQWRRRRKLKRKTKIRPQEERIFRKLHSQ